MSSNDSKSQSANAQEKVVLKTNQQKPGLVSFTKKNWDAIIDEFEEQEKESTGVDELFKQIYEAGSEDVRRAMNKSFQESGGTVLSTNWSNVANKKVDPKRPSDHDDDKEKDPSNLLS